MTGTQRPGVVVAALVAGAALAACGGGNDAQEAKIEKELARYGLEGNVELDGSGEVKNVTISKGDQKIGRNLSLPDGFPSDVALVTGWEIIHSAPSPNDGFMVQALVTTDVDAALAQLRANMEEDGWRETTFQQPAPTMTSIAFEKDDRMTSVNFIGASGDQINAQLMTMRKP
ncbi:MAG: hypothetical protein GC152_15995 [Alphaproteobacteria bacterium]|nr:hypothetical protein [Alphaproteobacteria bacterium]